ncbi:MAG: O-antigen ligase family protein [Betaproteobacteria bacterium]|jgi:O-antigen ligase|nr:O-antigen ligase family protein [Betaproteobacteria bacterium]MCC6248930.1 O-antigen ligase family protein [Rubrivivax sp.]MCL4696287.1 O-antigen ligase family protein [Burkholderiaceae bacterium]
MDPSAQDIALTVVGSAILVVAAALAVWLLGRLGTARLAPIALMLIGFVIEIFHFDKQPYVQIGLQIYPNDLISLTVMMAALLGFLVRPVPLYHPPFLLWLGLGVTIIASFVLGLMEFGKYAGTEVRPFFYVWVAALYCASLNFTAEDFRRMARWCVWTAYAVIAVAVYYYIAVQAGIVNKLEFFEQSEADVFRPVAAHGAIFVGSVAVVQTMAWLRGSGTRWSGWHAVACLAFVLVIQHRSAWIAIGIALLGVMILERQRLPRRFGLLLGFLLAATLGVAIAAAFGVFDELGRRLVQSVETIDDRQGTFAARFDGWLRLMDNWIEAPASVWLFGFPFGKGYTRMHFGQYVDFSPHNFYIDLLLRVGIVGTLLWLLPTMLVVGHGLRARVESEAEYLWTRGIAVLLLSVLIYCIVYPSNYLISAATGIAMSEMIRRRLAAPAGPRFASASPAVMPGAMPGAMHWRADR